MRPIALGIAVLCLTGTVFAQSGSDTPYQVRYWLTGGNSTIRVVNTGANGTAYPVCANFYAFNTSGQMTACCTCPVAANALLSLPLANNLIPAGTTPPSALVLKMVSSPSDGGGFCPGPATPGSLSAGLLAWLSGTQPESPFVSSTLSAGELAKLQGQCSALTPPSGQCRSCPPQPPI